MIIQNRNSNFTIAVLASVILALGATAVFSSCLNDNGNSAADKPVTLADSSTMAVSDSAKAGKPVAAIRKGKASATFNSSNNIKIEKDKEGVYLMAEKMPEYPGGQPALSQFVENNINYPQDAIDQNAEGTVNVSFIVDEKGKVLNPVASGKKAGHGLDDEAIKIVQQMPAWKPGTVKGKPVKTRLTLPVTFKLADA